MRVGDEPRPPFEIAAPSTAVGDDRTLVLASGDTFAVCDRHGEMRIGPASRHGLYAGGTRFLSGLWLHVAGNRPLLLSSGIRSEEGGMFVHESNPDVLDHPTLRLVRDRVHVLRHMSFSDGRCWLTISLRSYADHPIRLPIRLWFAADYADVFEVRGARRAARGRLYTPVIGKSDLELGYLGLDGVRRSTRLSFDPAPLRADDACVDWVAALAPGERMEIAVQIATALHDGETWVLPTCHSVRGHTDAPRDLAASLSTSSHAMNAWIRHSAADLAMLTVPTAQGPMPYAGIPWFCTPFGRDALIVALETLWIEPALARGVLRFLAAHQADADDPDRDAEPGKIVHEMRTGEMPALHEVPFERYYGSVDATPLFAMVAAAYFDRTGDAELLEELWLNIERALAWIDGPGDRDGDGFVEYQRRSKDGLSNQGWKDSWDSVMHADGSLAEGPIALCEVQAYVYGARAGLARAARRLGREARAAQLADDAERMRSAFGPAFWCEELATYGIALDGRKQLCRVRSSNAGHVLLTGLAQPEHAEAISRTMLSSDHFSGWGIRTLAATAPRYNPMSYHDGSVWPHDNALIAAGLARYGDTRAAAAILGGLFDAFRSLEDARLPELLCGFDRLRGEPPTLYPTACSPQAWASGAVFLLLQAVLGLTIDAERRCIRFAHPTLPAAFDQISIHGLELLDGTVDLQLERSGGETPELRVLRASEDIDVQLTHAWPGGA